MEKSEKPNIIEETLEQIGRKEKEWGPIITHALPYQELNKVLRDFLENASEIGEPQPHGFDLPVERILDLGLRSEDWRRYRADESFLEEVHFNAKTGKGQPELFVADLKPNHVYCALLSAKLKEKFTDAPYSLTLFPKSTLLRVGADAFLSTMHSFYTLQLDEGEIKKIAPNFEKDKSLTFVFDVKNPNGLEIEKGAKIVQAVLEKRIAMPLSFYDDVWMKSDKKLTLGKVFKFNDSKPFIAKDRLNENVNVLVPLRKRDGKWRLQSRTPYFFQSNEKVSLPEHVRALCRGGLVGIPEGTSHFMENIVCSMPALVDAGYRGPLHYLAMPGKDTSLESGHELTKVIVQKVPMTEKPYRGRWMGGHKQNN